MAERMQCGWSLVGVFFPFSGSFSLPVPGTAAVAGVIFAVQLVLRGTGKRRTDGQPTLVFPRYKSVGETDQRQLNASYQLHTLLQYSSVFLTDRARIFRRYNDIGETDRWKTP